MLRKAKEIAKRHPDDHPFQVAAEVQEFDKLVALLHDSLEDGYSSVHELEIWFDLSVVEDVLALTRLDNEDYLSYIEHVKEKGGRVQRVKIADININLARCKLAPLKWGSLIRRYEFALQILEE